MWLFDLAPAAPPAAQVCLTSSDGTQSVLDTAVSGTAKLTGSMNIGLTYLTRWDQREVRRRRRAQAQISELCSAL